MVSASAEAKEEKHHNGLKTIFLKQGKDEPIVDAPHKRDVKLEMDFPDEEIIPDDLKLNNSYKMRYC